MTNAEKIKDLKKKLRTAETARGNFNSKKQEQKNASYIRGLKAEIEKLEKE